MHPAEEGRAGTADVGGECPGWGLPLGVQAKAGTESGRELEVGERPAGCGIRQGCEGHHPRVLYQDREGAYLSFTPLPPMKPETQVLWCDIVLAMAMVECGLNGREQQELVPYVVRGFILL